MRSRRPSPTLVIAMLALFLAAGGGAFAAVRSTGSATNIVDATDATRIAHVSSGGSLQIAGSVTATQTSSTNFLRAAAFSLGGGSCVTLATPPSGKAMIVKEVVVDTFTDPTPGSGNRVTIYLGDCASVVADVNPGTVGATVVPFDPGLGVPAGSKLSVIAAGGVQAEAYMFGYSVTASAVPPVTAPEGTQAPQP